MKTVTMDCPKCGRSLEFPNNQRQTVALLYIGMMKQSTQCLIMQSKLDTSLKKGESKRSKKYSCSINNSCLLVSSFCGNQ